MWTQLSFAVVVVTMLIGSTIGKGVDYKLFTISKISQFSLLLSSESGQHRQFERLSIVFGHESVTAEAMYRHFTISIKSNPASCLIQGISYIFTSCGLVTREKNL